MCGLLLFKWIKIELYSEVNVTMDFCCAVGIILLNYLVKWIKLRILLHKEIMLAIII